MQTDIERKTISWPAIVITALFIMMVVFTVKALVMTGKKVSAAVAQSESEYAAAHPQSATSDNPASFDYYKETTIGPEWSAPMHGYPQYNIHHTTYPDDVSIEVKRNGDDNDVVQVNGTANQDIGHPAMFQVRTTDGRTAKWVEYRKLY